MTKFPPDLSPTGKALLLTEELFKATKAYLEADNHLQDALHYEYPSDMIKERIETMTNAKHNFLKCSDAIYTALVQGFHDEADILRMSGLEIVNGRYVKVQE